MSLGSTELTGICFSENSELRVIEKKAFSITNLERIKIPPSIEDLRYGWCNGLEDLYSCEIMPINKRYSNFWRQNCCWEK